ncbi:hypothetical protein ACVBEE_01600 [Acinetobacter sp. ANC 3781]
MSNATQIVDTSGPVATTAGTGITIISWLATWDWGFLIGVAIGLAGLAISFANYLSNKSFQKRKDQREQELHEVQMRKELEQCNVKD